MFGLGETATLVVDRAREVDHEMDRGLAPQWPRSSCASIDDGVAARGERRASGTSPSTAVIGALAPSASACPEPGAGVPTGSTKYSAAVTVRPACAVASAVAERCDVPGSWLVGLGSIVIALTLGPIRATMNVSLETSPQAPVESRPWT